MIKMNRTSAFIIVFMAQPSQAMELHRQEELNAQLFRIIPTGDLEQVKQLLHDGANMNARDEYDYTPLIQATRFNNAETIGEFLIACGADVDAQNKSGVTALMIAAEMGREKICDLLLARGVKTEIQTTRARTALMFAAQFGTQSICQKLLLAGASLFARAEHYSGTALIDASKKQRSEICRFLVDYQTQCNRGIITALLFFKTHENPFLRVIYKKKLLQPHLENHTLKALLNISEYPNVAKAYNYLPAQWLKPIGTTP